MPLRNLSVTLFLFAFALASSPAKAASIYNFEGLTTGQSIVGQDNWQLVPSWDDVDVASGTGVNPTTVAVGDNPAQNLASGVTRQNDANFDFDTFSGTETNAVLRADIRLGASSIRAGVFAVSSSSTGGFGPRFGLHLFPVDQFFIRRSDSTSIGSPLSTANGGSSAGSSTDWFRVEMRVDLTANGGDGAGSLFYMNLTNGETAFTPVAGLQNIDLQIASAGAVPSLWDTLFLRPHEGTQMDNLFVAVPEPSTAVLLVLGLAGLAAAGRRRSLH